MPQEKKPQPQTPRILATQSICKRLVLVLDSSGSMSSQKNDIIGGVNETIKVQRQSQPSENSTTNFNIVTFSDCVSIPQEHTLESVPFLSDSSYCPSGSTALFDAMGLTMSRYNTESGVIMIVATDGEENSSSKYSYKQIVEMVKNLRENKNWNFIYLSEDIDTFKQGESMGISQSTTNCNNIAVGKYCLGNALKSNECQSAISDMRKGTKNVKIAQTISSLSQQY